MIHDREWDLDWGVDWDGIVILIRIGFGNGIGIKILIGFFSRNMS